MAQLLIALETGTEPAISGRDNLKTMALVEAAYLSAAQFRSIGTDEISRLLRKGEALPKPEPPRTDRGFLGRLFTKLETNRQLEREPEELAHFTPRAQQVLALARREADRFHHNFVGTEHLLLGLISLGQGVAVNVLKNLGLDLDIVRIE